MVVQAAAQQQQTQECQPASQPASQSAQPLQNAAYAPAAPNGLIVSSSDPAKMLRMAESAAQHEARYKAKMLDAQASFDMMILIGCYMLCFVSTW